MQIVDLNEMPNLDPRKTRKILHYVAHLEFSEEAFHKITSTNFIQISSEHYLLPLFSGKTQQTAV